MKARTLIGLAAVTALGSAATADITYSFDNTYMAFSFEQLDANPLEGVLEGINGNFVMEYGESYTYADDLTVLIASEDLSDIFIQIGGWSDVGAGYRYFWPEGASDAFGTVGGGSITTVPFDVTGYYLFVGHGYAGGVQGAWSGEIELLGSVVPAPGALAVLGFAGLAGRRRRA